MKSGSDPREKRVRQAIRFIFGEDERTLSGLPPATTVLEWLRGPERAIGTKEGCAEGDCGACTVVLGEPHGDAMRYRPVCACLLFVPALDARQLITVEHLAGPGALLHPVQAAMMAHHASQCGFCTPGIVMSLFALHHEEPGAQRPAVNEALAGNLCRCTGYRPIVDAAIEACAVPAEDRFARNATAMAERLRALPRDSFGLEHDGQRWFSPRTSAEATALLAAYPAALVIAGATDAALWVTKQRRTLPAVVALDRVAEMTAFDTDAEALRIGAAVPYADAIEILAADWPELGAMLRRLGSRQIRHRGTIGGNLGTASPIGDMPPALIALDATVRIAGPEGTRALPVAELFTGYRRTALLPGELIARIDVPRPRPGETLHAYKITKRFEEDISAVCAAFRMRIEGGVLRALRAGFGGMAATPVRAAALEAAIVGRPWTHETIEVGRRALDSELSPISDMRASAAYRRLVARNLLLKLWLETSGADARTRLAEAA